MQQDCIHFLPYNHFLRLKKSKMRPENTIINNREIQKPQALPMNGMSGKFWPKMLATNVEA